MFGAVFMYTAALLQYLLPVIVLPAILISPLSMPKNLVTGAIIPMLAPSPSKYEIMKVEHSDRPKEVKPEKIEPAPVDPEDSPFPLPR